MADVLNARILHLYFCEIAFHLSELIITLFSSFRNVSYSETDNAVHVLPFYFFKVYFIIILPSTPSSWKTALLQLSPSNPCTHFSSPPFVPYVLATPSSLVSWLERCMMSGTNHEITNCENFSSFLLLPLF